MVRVRAAAAAAIMRTFQSYARLFAQAWTLSLSLLWWGPSPLLVFTNLPLHPYSMVRALRPALLLIPLLSHPSHQVRWRKHSVLVQLQVTLLAPTQRSLSLLLLFLLFLSRTRLVLLPPLFLAQLFWTMMIYVPRTFLVKVHFFILIVHF